MSEPTYGDMMHLLAGLFPSPTAETLPDGRKAYTWACESQTPAQFYVRLDDEDMMGRLFMDYVCGILVANGFRRVT